MSDNYFSDEDNENNENEEFRDIPEEVVIGKQAPPANVRVTKDVKAKVINKGPMSPLPVELEPEEADQEEEIEAQDEDEEDFTEVLQDARLRLEQGRLYEMIMNHDMFEELNADPKAVKHVQKQIRNFAKEQMEIMLGMRQEVQKVEQVSLDIEFPFNDLEVQTLKALASTATKGETQKPEYQQFSALKRETLTPITNNKSTARLAPLQPKKSAERKSLQNKPAAPIKRNKSEDIINKILLEEGISREAYEKTFNPSYTPLDKPLHEMTDKEIIERNRQAKLRSTSQVKSANAMPMPSPEAEAAMYTMRAQEASANPVMQGIMSAIANSKKK